jgi:cytochrome b6-f complex iron-sulfur subunit
MNRRFEMPTASMDYNGKDHDGAIFSRREFVLAALSGLIMLPVAAKLLSIITSFAGVPERSFSGSAIPTWVPAGLLKDLSEVPKSVNFGEDVVYVLKTKEGKAVAYSGVCTHAGCLVKYDEKKNIFSCPCHGGQFSTDGEVIGGPPPRDLDQHQVKVSLGRVLIGRKIEK